jgi:hypothetical protein
MKLINSLALALFLTTAEAFGPASPVSGNAFGVSSAASKHGDMSMRVSADSMKRRQKFNNVLKTAGIESSKEAVESQLLSSGTGALVESANWKVRKFMIRKIKAQAAKFDVEVDPSFGKP